MSEVTVLLVADDCLGFYFGFAAGEEKSIENAKTLYDLGQYRPLKTLRVELAGEDAAEEMFDLSNNPSRDDERAELYGRGRSVSTGDIVVVDEDMYLCMSCGWKKLDW